MPVFDNKKNEKIHENSYQKSISYHIQPKVNSYTNFYKIDSYPTVVTVKPQVYKPIIRPLILPATEALIEKSYYQSSWNIPYDWDNSRSNALGDFYYSNAQDFNTHQVQPCLEVRNQFFISLLLKILFHFRSLEITKDFCMIFAIGLRGIFPAQEKIIITMDGKVLKMEQLRLFRQI